MTTTQRSSFALPLVPQGFVVVIAAFLPIIAIVAMGPAVPAMIEHFASDPSARGKVPAMIGAPGLAMAILAPFAGFLVDRFGRRRLLLAATLAYGAFGSAPLFLDNLDHIYVSRLLLGVAEGAILTVVNTLIGDYWDGQSRKNWLFLQGLLGPFIAGFVALAVGYATKLQWNGVFYVYLVALPIWLAMYVWIFEPGHSDEKAQETAHSPAGPFPWGAASLIAAVTFGFSMLYYVFIINGSLVFAEVGVTDSAAYGAIIFVPQLFVLLGAVLFRLQANRPHAFQLGSVLLLLGAGLAGIGMARTPSAMAAALMIQQTAAGMTVPSLIGWAQTKFNFAHRGRGMGIWTASFFLAQSLSPMLVHLLDERGGSMQGAFLTAGFAGFAGCLIAFGSLILTKATSGHGRSER